MYFFHEKVYLRKCILGISQAAVAIYSKQKNSSNNNNDDDGNLNTEIIGEVLLDIRCLIF